MGFAFLPSFTTQYHFLDFREVLSANLKLEIPLYTSRDRCSFPAGGLPIESVGVSGYFQYVYFNY